MNLGLGKSYRFIWKKNLNFFRKNDIITIISEKDEHCWVGEVNGLRGWFPAKFVEAREQSNITISRLFFL